MKKWILLSLIMVMIFALAACGGEANSQSNSGGETSQPANDTPAEITPSGNDNVNTPDAVNPNNGMPLNFSAPWYISHETDKDYFYAVTDDYIVSDFIASGGTIDYIQFSVNSYDDNGKLVGYNEKFIFADETNAAEFKNIGEYWSQGLQINNILYYDRNDTITDDSYNREQYIEFINRPPRNINYYISATDTIYTHSGFSGIHTLGGLSGIVVGNTIKFGKYNDPFGTRQIELEWLVLDEKDGNALLLSITTLEATAYNLSEAYITWENSSMRGYLNDMFYDNSFSVDEKEKIIETQIPNNDNPWRGAAGGNDTLDKVFLLSIEEVVLYLGDSGQLTDRKNDGYMWIDDEYNDARKAGENGWWLRSPGNDGFLAAIVERDGRVKVYGELANTPYSYGVRPAMWLKLD